MCGRVYVCVCVYINAFVNAQPQREQLCKKKKMFVTILLPLLE